MVCACFFVIYVHLCTEIVTVLFEIFTRGPSIRQNRDGQEKQELLINVEQQESKTDKINKRREQEKVWNMRESRSCDDLTETHTLCTRGTCEVSQK